MITQYRKSYFHLLDVVCRETGNSKEFLHSFWTTKIFPFLIENPDNFNRETVEEYSTKYLSEQGWNTFLSEFRHFCLNQFNIS